MILGLVAGRGIKRGWNGAIAREKEEASETDGDPAKMRAWQREDPWESERTGDRVVVEGQRADRVLPGGSEGDDLRRVNRSEKENAFVRK